MKVETTMSKAITIIIANKRYTDIMNLPKFSIAYQNSRILKGDL